MINRYHVEFKETKSYFGNSLPKGFYMYVYAYSEQHVRDMFDDYELVAIDQTDAEEVA